MNVAGTWKGEYTYDENPEAPRMAGHAVDFTLELKQGWLGMVSGTVQDDPRSGIPEAGTVRGKIKGGEIEFTKILPVFRLMHEPNLLTLEKWAERNKVVMDTERPNPPVRHQGTLSEDGQTVSGTWVLGTVTLEVHGSYLTLTIPTLRGTWHMKRATPAAE